MFRPTSERSLLQPSRTNRNRAFNRPAVTSTSSPRSRRSPRRRSLSLQSRPRMRNTLSARDFSMLIALLLIWAYFIFAPMVIHDDYAATFVSSRNLSVLAVDLSITAILALGMLLVILPGHID